DPGTTRPTPWEIYTYDANDNAGRTHPDTSQSYATHWNTPASVELDALGRTVSAVIRNGPAAESATTWFTTVNRYDVEGNLLAIADPLGREAFRYRYDLMRRRWRVDSIAAGRRDTVLDAVSRPTEQRDSKDALILHAYDALHRQTRLWARDDASG